MGMAVGGLKWRFHARHTHTHTHTHSPLKSPDGFLHVRVICAPLAVITLGRPNSRSSRRLATRAHHFRSLLRSSKLMRAGELAGEPLPRMRVIYLASQLTLFPLAARRMSHCFDGGGGGGVARCRARIPTVR